MGPLFWGPPSDLNQRLKEPLPKNIKEVPGYLKRLFSKFFSRLFYIVKLVWQAKKSLLLMMFFTSVFNGVSPVISAFVSANLLNKIALVLTTGFTNLKEISAVILPAMLLQFGYMFFVSLVNSVSGMIVRTSSEIVTNHVKCKIMNKAKSLDLASFDNPEFYERLENANREAGMRPIEVIRSTFSIVSNIISVVSFITILSAVAWFAPLIVVLLSIPSAIITFYYRKKNFNYMRRNSKARRQMAYYNNTLVDKDLVKEMRLFSLSDTFIFNYNKVFKTYFKGIQGLILGEGIGNIVISLVTTAVNCALFFFIAFTVTKGSGQIGDYSLYTGALTSIASCVATLVTTTSGIYEGTLFIDNMIVFMNEEQKIIPSSATPKKVERHIGHTIEFKNVSFKYPGTERYVLKDISFLINPGDTVVLVGLNGAGKTTLLKLLTRLYDVTEGEILLDGYNIKEYDTDSLYNMYGVIFQDFGKYAFDVAQNIGFGEINKPLDRKAVEEAAKASSALDFINHLPNGFDTPLMRVFEQHGVEPSIGQWQKLAIARAFYSDSDVLILDEPTASLDAIAEQEIFNQFDTLRKDKTTFFVSHRLSSATIATKILVLNYGELVEMGNHKELMAQKGVYHNLFTTQANRYIEEAENNK